MYTLLYTNRSAMTAQQNKIDAISNNIANVNTVGYKKINIQFQDLYNNSLERLGYPTSDDAENLYVGSGIKSTTAQRQFSQGSLHETGLTTDIAIDGRGLFKVYKQDGTSAYTRNGNFKVDATGVLVDNNGYRLSVVDNENNELNYNGGPLNLTGDNFNIDKAGNFYLKNENGFENVGQVKTYDSVGGNGLISSGESLFVPIEGVNMEEVTDRNIHVGYLENANVDIGQEMTDMILTQRAFQLNSTGLKTVDEMWQMINNLR
jgi:flagellar basal-body rod protein FlgG